VKSIRRAVILDWDGTLVDSSSRQYHCHREILKGEGLRSRLSFEDFWRLRRGGKKIRELLPGSLAPEIVQRVEARWVLTIESPQLLRLDALYPGARQCLGLLRRTCDLYLCSLRQDSSALHEQLRRLHVVDFFADIFVGSPIGRRSKRDLILPAVLHPSGPVGPVIVGDTEIDVMTGREACIQTVAVSYGNRSRRFLTQLHPDIIVDRIGDIPDAVGIKQKGVSRAARLRSNLQ
jgi:phosphoglycolate phosphatase-like HAD superfamily hydrolase